MADAPDTTAPASPAPEPTTVTTTPDPAPAPSPVIPEGDSVGAGQTLGTDVDPDDWSAVASEVDAIFADDDGESQDKKHATSPADLPAAHDEDDPAEVNTKSESEPPAPAPATPADPTDDLQNRVQAMLGSGDIDGARKLLEGESQAAAAKRAREEESRDWRYAALRRKEAAHAKAAEDLAQRQAQIQAERQRLGELARIPELVRQDPERVLAWAEQAAGLKQGELYDRLTQRRLTGTSRGDQDDVRRELAELRQQMTQRDQQAAEASKRQAFLARVEQSVSHDVETMMGHLANGGGDRYKALATVPEPELRGMLREATMSALREVGPGGVTMAQIVSSLDQQEQTRLDQARERLERLNRGAQPGATAVSGDASKTPPSPTPGRRQTRTITPRDASSRGGGARRELSPEEALMAADDILQGRVQP